MENFQTFALFLTSKGITKEAFDAMNEEGKAGLLKSHAEGQEAYIKNLIEEGKTSKEEIEALKKDLSETIAKENKALVEAVKTQGMAITKLMNSSNGMTMDTIENEVFKFLEENKEKIQSIKEAGHGFIELKLKAVNKFSTGDVTNLTPANPNIIGTEIAPPSNVRFRTMNVMSLVSTFNTNQATFAYTDVLPSTGDAGFVQESGTKPNADFEIYTRYASPVKVAVHQPLTEEAITDIPQLQSVATDFLRKRHDLKKAKGILFGNGLAGQPEGATVLASAFSAGDMALKVTSPNFMDVVNACITQIYTTVTDFTDEEEYMANLVMVNPTDFYLELVSAKDANGLPLYPSAGLFNQVQIGGVTIVPEQSIPSGKIFVADMSKYNVSNYVGYSVRIGWINDQLIKNQFTMVGESRFHAFVKQFDRKAFVYDDIATIKTAITKV